MKDAYRIDADPEPQDPGEAKFQKQVFSQLPPIPDPRDEAHVRACINQLYRDGFNISWAVAWCNCLAEANPELEEHVALARMDAIMKHVKRSQHRWLKEI